MFKKKFKVIIDSDPGVDDCLALTFALNEPRLDIKLLCVAPGNVPVQIGSRNMLHLLDLYRRNIPVVQGSERALLKTSSDATYLHGKQGMGGYQPPEKTRHQLLKDNFMDKMYEVIKENAGEIIILEFGTHTNLAKLFQKYPDCVNMIKEVIFEGAQPLGLPGFGSHVSFNVRTDPEAFDIVLKSGVKLTMIPSKLGRGKGRFTEKQVYGLKEYGDVGKLMYEMFSIYWEPKQTERFIATNDTAALLCLLSPRLYRYKRANMTVDLTDVRGKTFAMPAANGRIKIAVDLNRRAYQRNIYRRLKKLKDIKFDKRRKS